MRAPKLIVITTPGASSGYALAGVHVLEALDAHDAERHLTRLDATEGVIIVDQRLYEELPDELRKSLNRSPTPVVIPVPGPNWGAESTAHEYIVDILRRAIGYRVRLQ